MISDREFFRSFGFELEIEPAKPDFLIEETPSREFLGAQFQVLEVPGHCPGSLCFFLPKDRLLIGGDVLFAGSIGRGIYRAEISIVLVQEIRKNYFRSATKSQCSQGTGRQRRSERSAALILSLAWSSANTRVLLKLRLRRLTNNCG